MQPAPILKVAVIGSGIAGREFALLCVSAGFDVILEDVMPAKLRRAQDIYLASAAPNSKGTLRFAQTVEEAVRSEGRGLAGVDLAIDFVPDELESKLEIFCMIDRMAPPRTILLTPTDTLNITDLASCTYRSDRCFAVRGQLAPGQEVSLLLPRKADSTPALSAGIMLRNLGMFVSLADENGATSTVTDASGYLNR